MRKVTAKGHLKTSTMNKTEAAYANRLELLLRTGEVLWYKFEGVRLRLADDSYFKPDFAVMVKDGTLEIHEVKGFWWEAAKVRIRVAADIYPFRFLAVKAEKGGWEVEIF